MRRTQLIDHMRPLLLKRRAELRKVLDDELATIVGECEEDLGDTADLAMESGSREVNAQLIDVESRELEHIEEALERLREGTYGSCSACGKNIPMTRLQALPYATTCIDCQRSLDLSAHASGVCSSASVTGGTPHVSWSVAAPTALS